MGRKGVSKRKKAKGKAPGTENNSGTNGRKAENQPEHVKDKGKFWPKDNKKN